jgi:hypothetical protein
MYSTYGAYQGKRSGRCLKREGNRGGKGFIIHSSQSLPMLLSVLPPVQQNALFSEGQSGPNCAGIGWSGRAAKSPRESVVSEWGWSSKASSKSHVSEMGNEPGNSGLDGIISLEVGKKPFGSIKGSELPLSSHGRKSVWGGSYRKSPGASTWFGSLPW